MHGILVCPMGDPFQNAFRPLMSWEISECISPPYEVGNFEKPSFLGRVPKYTQISKLCAFCTLYIPHLQEHADIIFSLIGCSRVENNVFCIQE